VCVLICWVHVLERDTQKGGGDREKQLEVRTRHVQCKMQCTQRAVLARVGGLFDGSVAKHGSIVL
jgi:hypothetical protein